MTNNVTKMDKQPYLIINMQLEYRVVKSFIQLGHKVATRAQQAPTNPNPTATPLEVCVCACLCVCARARQFVKVELVTV